MPGYQRCEFDLEGYPTSQVNAQRRWTQSKAQCLRVGGRPVQKLRAPLVEERC